MKKILLGLMVCYSFAFAELMISKNGTNYIRFDTENVIGHEIDTSSQCSSATLDYVPYTLWLYPRIYYYNKCVPYNAAYYRQNDIIPYDAFTSSCPSGTTKTATDSSTLWRCIPDSPTCDPETQDEVDGKCICKNGFNDDEIIGTCKPDIDCPAPMIYKVTDAWHGYWATNKRCVPDSTLSQTDCEAINGAVYGSLDSGVEAITSNALMYGEGCVSENYSKSLFINDATHNIIGFMPFSYLWKAENDLAVQLIDKLFAVGKNGFNAIKNKFASSTQTPKPNLATHEAQIIEMQIGSDGVAYEVALSPKTPPKDNPTSWWDTYQKFRENGWDLPQTPSTYNPKINDPIPPTVNPPKFPVVAKEIDDFFYKGGDSLEFTNNMLGSAKISKDGSVPNLSVLESSPINRQVETTINLNSKLVGTETKSYPTYLVKDTQIALSDRVESTYKGFTKYPDGTKTYLDISRTKYNVDGRIIDDVVTTTNIPTKSGTKIFNTSYQTFKDGNGAITNVISKPTSITTTTSTGTVTTTNNATNSITTNSSKSAVDLSPVIVKLESIESKIQSIIDTPIPKEIAEATVRVQQFNDAIDLFDVGFNSYKDFVDGMVGNINELTTLFDDSKAILENKPVVNEITGTCGFNASFFEGHTIFIDPCMFVAPYRPILALIFTLLATFSVIGFSVKYLVARGD